MLFHLNDILVAQFNAVKSILCKAAKRCVQVRNRQIVGCSITTEYNSI